MCNKQAADCRVTDWVRLTEAPRTFSLTEFQFSLTNLPEGLNVYREDELDAVCTFTSPNGTVLRITAFYYEEHLFDETVQLLGRGTAPGCFRVRVSLPEAGKWQYTLTVTVRGTLCDTLTGTVTAADSGRGSRILEVEPRRRQVFRTRAGENTLMIGRNLAWSAHPQEPGEFGRYTVENIHQLADNGGNAFRIWDVYFCTSHNRLRVHQMDQGAGAMWDRVFEAADERDVYISLVLFPHGEVSTRVDPSFELGPWSTKRGGYLENAADFFVDDRTIGAVKTYIRYIVARYGHSEHVIWELFNEIDHSEAMCEGRIDDVRAWLKEMKAYFKACDPYGHIVTNSAGFPSVTVGVCQPMEFVYYHFYNFYGVSQLATLCRNAYRAYQRPVVIGEYGYDGPHTRSLLGGSYFSPDFLELYQGNWASMMSGGASTAMNWWWDCMPRIGEPYGMFRPVAAMAKRIPWDDEAMQLVSSETVAAVGNTRIETLGYVGGTYAYLWFYDNRCLAMNRETAVFEGETVPVPMADGAYRVEWISTRTGEVVEQATCTAQNGTLTLTIPTWSEDIALAVEPAE